MRRLPLTPLLATVSSLLFLPGLTPGQELPEISGMIRSAIGVTRQGTPIPCFLTEDDLDPETEKYRVLLVGGLDGSLESTQAVLEALKAFQGMEKVSVSAVPCARPDDLGTKDLPPMKFPPGGNAYNQAENDVAHYLWRWIQMHAPDRVIVVEKAAKSGLAYPAGISDIDDKVPLALVPLLEGGNLKFDPGLEDALAGEFRPLVFQVIDGNDGETLPKLLPDWVFEQEASSARREIQRRVARTPIKVAEELAKVYGRKMDPVMYIPALAIVGRMRLGELTGDPAALRDAEKICAPFRNGEKESMPPKGNGSTLSGHLVFSELARRTGDGGWTTLATKAADFGFDETGKPKASMPFHSEMSDSVFMGCAILAEAGQLTGDQKYFAQCLRHLRFMEKLCLREDGIYRHSPLDEAAWGRGNGFPALGMALSLSALPKDSAEHAAFLESYRNHLTALRKHQDPTGAWHQVIDHEESYREFTSTCMITFAIARGLRRGWLDAAEWQPVVDKAWTAIKSRIGPDGHLVDVCTGTGKMKSLRDYFDRTAILGRDDRGGAMALMVSTEIAFWEREKEKR